MEDTPQDGTPNEKIARRAGTRKKSPRSPRGNYAVSEDEPDRVSPRSSKSPKNSNALSDSVTTSSSSVRSSREKMSSGGESGANERATPAEAKRVPSAHKVYLRSLTSARIDLRTAMAAIPGLPGENWREMTARLSASSAARQGPPSMPSTISPASDFLYASFGVQPPGRRGRSPRQSVPVRSPFAPPTALDALLAAIDNSASSSRERSNSEPFINSWSYHSSSPIVPITHPQLRRLVSKRTKTVRQTSLVFRNHPQTQQAQHTAAQRNANQRHNLSSAVPSSSLMPISHTVAPPQRKMSTSRSSGDLASSNNTISTGSLDSSAVKRKSREKSKERHGKEKLRDKDKERSKDRDREKEKNGTPREGASPSDVDGLFSSPRSPSATSDSTKSSKRSGSKSKLSSEKERLKLPVRAVTMNTGSTHDSLDSPLSSPTDSRSMPVTPKSTESDESDDWMGGGGHSPNSNVGLSSPSGKIPRHGSTLNDSKRSPRSIYSAAGSPPRSDSAPGSALGTPGSARSRRGEPLLSDSGERSRSRSRAKSGSEGVYFTDTENQKIRSPKRPKLRSIDGIAANIVDDVPSSGRRSARKKSEVVVPLQPFVSPRPRTIPNSIWLNNIVDEDEARMFCNYLQANFKDTQFCEAVILMHTEIVCSRYLLDNLLSLYACAAIEQNMGLSTSPPTSFASSNLLSSGEVSPRSLSSNPPSTYESDYEVGQSQRQRKSRVVNTTRPTKPASETRPEAPVRFSSLRQGAVGGVTWADMPSSPTSTNSSINVSVVNAETNGSTPPSKRAIPPQAYSSSRLNAPLQPPSILQTSILNFLKKWVRLNTQDFTDDSVLQDMVRDFVTELRRKPGIECQMGGLIWDLFESSLHKLDDDPNAYPLSNFDILFLLGKLGDPSASRQQQEEDYNDALMNGPLSPHRISGASLSSSSPVSSKLKLVPSVSASSLSSSSSSGSMSGGTTNSSTPTLSSVSAPSVPALENIPEYLFKFTEFPSPILGREALNVIQGISSSMNGSFSPSTNSSIGVLDVSPLELARQWCLLDHTSFAQVRFRDFLRFASHPEDCPSLDTLSQGFNHATSWVAYQILRVDNPKKRARVAVHMISLAEELWQLNNFHAFFGVIIGLTQLSVARLRATWKQVGKKELKSLRTLQQTVSPINNFAALRSVHDNTPPPFVPLPTLFLRDLVMLAEASHDGFINPSTSSVNVDKVLMIEKLLGRLHSAQRNHYKFVPIKSVQQILLQGVAVASEELEAWSARVEPGRES